MDRMGQPRLSELVVLLLNAWPGQGLLMLTSTFKVLMLNSHDDLQQMKALTVLLGSIELYFTSFPSEYDHCRGYLHPADTLALVLFWIPPLPSTSFSVAPFPVIAH